MGANGIRDTTYETIMGCNVDIRKVFYCNVFVVLWYHHVRQEAEIQEEMT